MMESDKLSWLLQDGITSKKALNEAIQARKDFEVSSDKADKATSDKEPTWHDYWCGNQC